MVVGKNWPLEALIEDAKRLMERITPRHPEYFSITSRERAAALTLEKRWYALDYKIKEKLDTPGEELFSLRKRIATRLAAFRTLEAEQWLKGCDGSIWYANNKIEYACGSRCLESADAIISAYDWIQKGGERPEAYNRVRNAAILGSVCYTLSRFEEADETLTQRARDVRNRMRYDVRAWNEAQGHGMKLRRYLTM